MVYGFKSPLEISLFAADESRGVNTAGRSPEEPLVKANLAPDNWFLRLGLRQTSMSALEDDASGSSRWGLGRGPESEALRRLRVAESDLRFRSLF